MMKAHINGITVEGTPQEIMEYQRLQGEKKRQDWQKQMGTGYNPNQFMPKVTCIQLTPLQQLGYALSIMDKHTKKWDE